MPRRDNCIDLEVVFKLLSKMGMSKADILKRMYAYCEDCRERCTGDFPDRLEDDTDPPEYEPQNITEHSFQCLECKDISETLEFINGKLTQTQKWKQENGKIWHVHRDKLFKCKELGVK